MGLSGRSFIPVQFVRKHAVEWTGQSTGLFPLVVDFKSSEWHDVILVPTDLLSKI
jgi:hypothetical protein